LIDLEIALVERFDWSLRDIDETNVESLLPFIFRLNYKDRKGGKTGKRTVAADQVSWL
jgi:hypothetical protein